MQPLSPQTMLLDRFHLNYFLACKTAKTLVVRVHEPVSIRGRPVEAYESCCINRPQQAAQLCVVRLPQYCYPDHPCLKQETVNSILKTSWLSVRWLPLEELVLINKIAQFTHVSVFKSEDCPNDLWHGSTKKRLPISVVQRLLFSSNIWFRVSSLYYSGLSSLLNLLNYLQAYIVYNRGRLFSIKQCLSLWAGWSF